MSEKALAEKIEDIAYKADADLYIHIELQKQIKTFIKFCDKYNLQEEKRITLLKYEANKRVISDFKRTVNELIEILKMWNS